MKFKFKFSVLLVSIFAIQADASEMTEIITPVIVMTVDRDSHAVPKGVVVKVKDPLLERWGKMEIDPETREMFIDAAKNVRPDLLGFATVYCVASDRKVEKSTAKTKHIDLLIEVSADGYKAQTVAVRRSVECEENGRSELIAPIIRVNLERSEDNIKK